MTSRIPRTATVVIAAITVIAWLIGSVLVTPQTLAIEFGFIPARLSGAALPGAVVPAILTPLTAAFVHSGALHIGFNILIFLWCGSQVERILGRTSLIVLYVLGAFAAAIAQWAVEPSSPVPMIGASGAVSAVMGAFALSFGRARMLTRSPRINRWVNALWLMAAWIVLQLMIGWLAGGQGYLLATPAHIGGFAAGLLLQRPLLLWRYRSA